MLDENVAAFFYYFPSKFAFLVFHFGKQNERNIHLTIPRSCSSNLCRVVLAYFCYILLICHSVADVGTSTSCEDCIVEVLFPNPNVPGKRQTHILNSFKLQLYVAGVASGSYKKYEMLQNAAGAIHATNDSGAVGLGSWFDIRESCY